MRTNFSLLIILCGMLLPPPSYAQNQQQEVRKASTTHAVIDPLDVQLDYLPLSQRMEALIIVAEYRSKVRDLQQRICSKKSELEDLSYNSTTLPNTLARLGCELQTLRDELQALLIQADQHMRRELGIPLGTLVGRGCSMEFTKQKNTIKGAP